MATEFTMPKLGLTMEEATILEWLVADGQAVSAGSAVMRIETDKVETDVEISTDGVLHHVGRPGDVFACGAVIAYVLEPGEAPPASGRPLPPPTSVASMAAAPVGVVAPADGGVERVPVLGGRLLVSPNARRVAAERGVDLATVAGTGPGGRIVSEDVESAAMTPPLVRPVVAAPAGASGAGSSAVATMAARNLADLLGVDLAVVPPDPAEGLVTRDALARYVRQRLAVQVPVPVPPTPAPLLQTPTRTVRLAGMRGTIARRMHSSLREMAQLTLTMDADMDAVVADRERRKAAGAAPGFTDYVVAAAARTLVNHPNVNAQVVGEEIAVLPDVHVGLAVALDNGLVVPVVRHTDRLTLEVLAAETTRLATAARAGQLAPGDLDGGTFSVTALGMFGVDSFTPVINPPNAAILGVGRLRDDVVVVDGVVGTRKRLTLSLTWDHRVFDGAPAAEFCRAIVAALADPASLG